MTEKARPIRDPQRKPALAGAALIAVSIALVAVGRHDRTPTVLDPATVRQSMELKFVDKADGSVVAVDAANGVELERIAPGGGGFIRVTMRSFASERKHLGLGSDVPFTLLRMADGDLILQDRLTGRTMLLNAFGPSNEGVFAALIDHGRTTQ
ncbi:MAG: photosynthetic complex assembly protein PuhC [Hyphomicrobiales bacterium]|nr:photosynthetic complex assembly protein PuhC [Hyphomicrobiales bacterium]